jgi:outer membrane immunogenic protein
MTWGRELAESEIYRSPIKNRPVSLGYYLKYNQKRKEIQMNLKNFLLIVAVSSIPVASHATGFSGPYAGAQLGMVNGTDSGTELFNGAADGYTTETSPKGNAYGLLGGYNWTLDNNLILGVEADYEQRSADGSSEYKLNGTPDPQFPVKTKLNAAYSLRAKLGYAFNENKTLAFVTAGVAAANIARTYSDTAVPASIEVSKSQNGWAAGLGVEHLIKQNISVGLEYRYADYGKTDVDTSAIYGAGYTQPQKYHESSFRVAVAYRF